jgi:hypothetical protein
MKNTWFTPQLTHYGSVEELTQVNQKIISFNNGFIVTAINADVCMKNCDLQGKLDRKDTVSTRNGCFN